MARFALKLPMNFKEGTVTFFKVLKVLSPVSGVGMISTICIFLSAVYYFCLIPYQWHAHFFPIFLLHLIIAHWILVNTLYNYILAIIIHPGKSKGQGPSKCRSCRTNRPERSHHCRQCNFCVLLMDHHCVWINNCVGFYNYGYYIRSCIYCWMGALYGTWTLWPEIAAYSNTTTVMFPYQDVPNVVVGVWVLCVGVLVAFSILNSWQLYLISSGMTSVEYKQLRAWKGAVSPYDRGWKTNMACILGTRGKSWFTLLRPSYYIPQDYWSEVELEEVESDRSIIR